jgi:lipoprotein-anchoring transpeptidase ErfK/SrfK
VTFANPVIDRAAAERTITVSAARPMTGRFEWTDDNVVQWLPDGFWPAHSTVKVTAAGWKTDFNASSAVVGVVSISKHRFTVSIDDQVVRDMPASMGKPKHPTPTGTFSAMSKERSVIMDSRTIGIPLNDPEGYRLTVNWAVRVTSGGVYVHSAPWSVDQQGVSNVSHGCVNLSPDNAEWYFNTVHIGDPIIVQA